MATLDERYGQLWWDPAAGAVQDDRAGFAPSAAPSAAPQRDFLEGSTNLYRDEQGVIRNLRPSEAAPAPAAPGLNSPMSPLAARYAESQRAGGQRLDDPFGIARNAYVSEQRAAEMQAYKTADYLSQFLPPERVAAETRRLTGVDLSGRLASTPNMMSRAKDELGLQETQGQIAERKAKTAETAEDTAKKATARKAAPLQDYQAVESAMYGLNRLEALAAEIRDAPGLWRAAGPIAGKLGTVTQQSANIEAKLKTLKAKVGFRVLQEMRDNSKTGGALGNVSEKEIDFLQNALESLDLTQSPEALRQSMDGIIEYADRLRRSAGIGYANLHGAPEKALPVAARAKIEALPEGVPAKLGNGQVWVMRGGVPARIR